MFSNLKATKIIVFVGLLLVIIFKINFSDLLLAECYTDQPSYYAGDEVTLYYSSHRTVDASISIPIFDINKNESFSVELPCKKEKIERKKALINGMQIKNKQTFIIPKDAKSGIYFINGKHPLIIKSKTPQSNISVVYPFMNNQIYQPLQHQTVFNIKAPQTSLLRTAYEDDYTKGLKKLFTDIEANYITDIDLENNTNLKNQQLLIIYGKATYYTPKMKQNIDDFVENGGNLLIMSSYYQNNICWYNSSTAKVTLIHPKSNAIQSWQGYLNQQNDSITALTPLSYVYGGFSTDKNNLQIASPQHPIFKGVKNFNVNSFLDMSLSVFWENEQPFIDTSEAKIYNAEILAFGKASYNNDKGIRGIFVFQPSKTSGKIISLVSEDWCLEKNFAKNKDIQLITKNAIDYLMK